jgi:hypothetical protein
MVLAWLIAATRVVLPYDEAFLGLDREALPSINARLLAFMAWDHSLPALARSRR